METVKDIAALLGVILSFISLITLTSKAGRSFISSVFKKNTQSLQDTNKKQTEDLQSIHQDLNLILKKVEGLEELSKQQCRDVIKDLFYRYKDSQKIPLYERKTADKTYKIYKDVFDGNSYAALLYEEICKWEIDAHSYQDFNED